ncbi:MAG TPA: hypothetical protein VFS67_27485 [Polyangiaceae bacterium]|nr:hypothetical protein [Polyangiaceae bacterium]
MTPSQPSSSRRHYTPARSASRSVAPLATPLAAAGLLLSTAAGASAQEPSSQPAAGASVSGSATVQTEAVTVSPPQAEAAPPSNSLTSLDAKLDIGLGLRTEFVFDPDEPEPDDAPVYAVNYDLRPYISGQVNRYIKFEGNLDSEATNNLRVLDAVLKFEFSEYANIWVGHFLPPSDRANLSGPYYRNTWSGTDGVNAYPAEFAGRDSGLAYWGQYAGGVVKWQLGFFNMGGGGTPDPRFAGRVVVNLFDPEPGYYNSSTYYGTKEILAFGAAIQHEPAPQGADDDAANTMWNLDALWEKNFTGVGTLDVEGAFYGFNGHDQGTSFFLLGSFLFPEQVGIGQFQPVLQLQRAQWGEGEQFVATVPPLPPGTDASLLSIDAGLQYIINGHNARLAATLRYNSLSVGDADDVTDTVIVLGAQIQAF